MQNRTNDFETQLMIHRPEIYEKYMEEKKEREETGYDHIVWKTPSSREEAEFIMDVIAENNKRIQEKSGESGQNDEEEKDFSVEMNFLQQFEGIDISQLENIEEQNGGQHTWP